MSLNTCFYTFNKNISWKYFPCIVFSLSFYLSTPSRSPQFFIQWPLYSFSKWNKSKQNKNQWNSRCQNKTKLNKNPIKKWGSFNVNLTLIYIFTTEWLYKLWYNPSSKYYLSTESNESEIHTKVSISLANIYTNYKKTIRTDNIVCTFALLIV